MTSEADNNKNETKLLIHWNENETPHQALWRSESGQSLPKKIVIGNDTTKADLVYRLACEGSATLWRGDFQNAKQLLQALSRRAERKPKAGKTPAESFHLHRQAQSQRARILGMLLIPFEKDYHIPLRRSPNVHLALQEVFGQTSESFVMSLRELLGLIGAHEWRKKGVFIPTLGHTIHPHYGVFSPVRGEYLDLVSEALLPSKKLAFDIGTGTGVLACILANRGVEKIIATDQDPRALACAEENVDHLQFKNQIQITKAHLFPEGKAPLIICNPPWIPARPSSPIENAIYDFESQMLKGFLKGLNSHLEDQGEGWLIISDIAEHLGLRTREELLQWINEGDLKVLGRLDTKPKHSKAQDSSDPLHSARSKEVTSLWRLGKK